MFENAHFINMAFDPAVPYNDLPTLPPSREMEDKQVLKACIQARVALSGLNQVCIYFPIPALLSRAYPVLEAHASCALDGDTVALDDLFKLPAEASTSDAKIERVLAVCRALALGRELVQARALDISILQELCSTIERSPMPVRRVSAQLLDSCNSHTKQYTPPIGSELLQSLLGNWERFIHVDAGNLDPLVLMAIAHYQLQAIHPFSASNGTVARLVDYLLLHEESVLNEPVLNLSTWYYRNKQDYTQLQIEVTKQQHWRNWILFFLKGMAVCAEETTLRLKAIESLIRHTDEHIVKKLPKIYSTDLLHTLFSEPSVRIQNLVGRGIARRQTASVYLKKLSEIGVLNEVPYGKEKLFLHHKLLSLIIGNSDQYRSYQN